MISVQTAVILLLAALVIYALELFIPSAGALFILGTSCVCGSLVVAFMHNTTTGAVFVIIVTILALILPGIGIQIWKRSPIGKRMFLEAPQPFNPDRIADTGIDAAGGTDGNPPAARPAPAIDYVSLRGAVGKTLTPLRPAGATDFDGRRIDTVAEGVVIDRGEYVRVVDVQGNRVVVRRFSQPELDAFNSDLSASLTDKIEKWSLDQDT